MTLNSKKIWVLSEFFAILGCDAHLRVNFRLNILEIDQDNLRTKLNWCCRAPMRISSDFLSTAGLMTYRCLHGQAPRYLADHVTPAIEVASRHRLRSANRHRLIVPRCRLNTYGRRPSPGFSGRQSNGLELTAARWTQRSGVWCRQLQTVL